MTAQKTTKDLLQAPKGMRDFFHDSFYSKQGFFEKAEEIARYYGFQGIETPVLEHEAILSKGVGDDTDIVSKEMYRIETQGGDRLVLRPEGTAGIMRSYIEHGMGSWPQPVFLYYGGPFFRHEKPQKGRYRQFYQFGLEILGSDKAVLDAITIHVGYLILKESGLDIRVKLNTLGDLEVRQAYEAKLKAFYQEHQKELGALDQARIDSNPLRILDSKDEQSKKVNEDVPTSIGSLNETSSEHFKKVLEYLDAAHIPYEIDHALVRGLDYYVHTVFEYICGEESLALGGGGRYDGLAQTMGHNKAVPGIGLGLGVDRILEYAQPGAYTPKTQESAQFFFIQLGFEAKAKSFEIIEILREHEIAVEHSLAKNNLAMQLSIAEEKNIPYAIIFGQKEALDNMVIIRDMKKRSQTSIAIADMAEYIKQL